MNKQKPRESIILLGFDFYPRTVNKTNIVFTNEELNVLDKGLNFNLPQTGKKGIFNELINAEVAIKTIPDEDTRNAARFILSNKINKRPLGGKQIYLTAQQKLDHIALQNIKDKLTDNDACYARLIKVTQPLSCTTLITLIRYKHSSKTTR